MSSDIQIKELRQGMAFTPCVSGYSPRTVLWVIDMKNSANDDERTFEVCVQEGSKKYRCTFKGSAWVRLVEVPGA